MTSSQLSVPSLSSLRRASPIRRVGVLHRSAPHADIELQGCYGESPDRRGHGALVGIVAPTATGLRPLSSRLIRPWLRPTATPRSRPGRRVAAAASTQRRTRSTEVERRRPTRCLLGRHEVGDRALEHEPVARRVAEPELPVRPSTAAGPPSDRRSGPPRPWLRSVVEPLAQQHVDHAVLATEPAVPPSSTHPPRAAMRRTVSAEGPSLASSVLAALSRASRVSATATLRPCPAPLLRLRQASSQVGA